MMHKQVTTHCETVSHNDLSKKLLSVEWRGLDDDGKEGKILCYWIDAIKWMLFCTYIDIAWHGIRKSKKRCIWVSTIVWYLLGFFFLHNSEQKENRNNNDDRAK